MKKMLSIVASTAVALTALAQQVPTATECMPLTKRCKMRKHLPTATTFSQHQKA